MEGEHLSHDDERYWLQAGRVAVDAQAQRCHWQPRDRGALLVGARVEPRSQSAHRYSGHEARCSQEELEGELLFLYKNHFTVPIWVLTYVFFYNCCFLF